jgi:hypothetical protein
VRNATGLDLFEKPFFRTHRDFILYGCPAFGLKAPFGDIGLKDRPGNNDRTRSVRIMATLAEELGDPYAAWYVSCGNGESERTHRVRVIVPRAKKVTPKAPTDLPPAKCFRDTGWALFHTDLASADDVFFAFKSSPYGSVSHSHADQNSFVLSIGERRLLTDSGYYAGYGSPHHLGWYKQSKAHNTILVDGRGQLVNSIKAGGHITHFANSGEIDYVVGDAQAAYGVLLERFDRHVVFLRPNVFVVFDDIVAAQPARMDWLLHAPKPFKVDETVRALVTRNGNARCRVHLFGPREMTFSVTDRFDPAPPGPASTWNTERYLPEHHFKAHACEAAKETKFLATVAVGRKGRAPLFVEDDAWLGVETPAGAAFFRKGECDGIKVSGRQVETDAKALVLRPSGSWLAADCSRLTIDGQTVVDTDAPASVRTGRLC